MSHYHRKPNIITLIQKLRKPRSRSKILFIVPKIAIILYISLSQDRINTKSNHCNKVPTNTTKDIFDSTFLLFCQKTSIRCINEQITIKIQNRKKRLIFTVVVYPKVYHSV